MHIAESYLWDKWYSSLQDTPKKNVLKLIQGNTGQGKTHIAINEYFKELMNNREFDLIIMTAPQTSAMSAVELNQACQTVYSNTEYVYNDVLEAMQRVILGRKVVLLTTNSNFIGQKMDTLLSVVTRLKLKAATFHDEAHSWTVSSAESYKDTMGHHATEDSYGATMYHAISKWAKYTPYTYGLTATPNPEQIGRVSVDGSLKFQILNERCPKKNLIGRSAWLDVFNTYGDLSIHLGEAPYTNASDAILTEIDIRMSKNSDIGFKNVVMIHAATAHTSSGLRVEECLRLSTSKFIDNHNYAGFDSNVVAVMTSKPYETGFYTALGGFTPASEDEIISAMEDQSHPAMVLIVVGKGQMGMNISNLKTIVVARLSEKGDSFGVSIQEAALQLLGRALRLSVPINDMDTFKSKYGYDLAEYVKVASPEEIRKLMVSNSIRIAVPSNKMWEDAKRTFLSEFVSTLEEAADWIMDLTQTANHVKGGKSIIELLDEKTGQLVYVTVNHNVNAEDVLSVHIAPAVPSITGNQKVVEKTATIK